MDPRPSGTITFLFTDIEGSSRLWEQFPAAMGRALMRHDELLREAAERYRGFVFKTVGDAFCVAFHNASDALAAAIAVQRELASLTWEETDPITVRMGLHTGTAEQRNDDYFGPALNRVARIMSAGHGGQILLCRVTAGLVRQTLPQGVLVRDLGQARLRDLKDPERLFQLCGPGLRADFPPLRSLESIPNNLPVQLTNFIGRERELAEVKRLAGIARLVTLTGPGGTGKTRLLVEAGAILLNAFPDGVWLVELATLSDPDLLAEGVVSSIGLRGNPDQTLEQTVIDFLRDREALLLLDNCEHLLRECALLVQTLLRHAPRVRILASSRSPLGIHGETVLPVPTLSLPNLWGSRHRHIDDPVKEYSAYEAVRFFAERAAAARPGFSLTAANAESVARICWRLDGIPHAIELAAARAKVLSPEQILKRLDDRFQLLSGGSSATLPHQQTLRTMIDWSYDMLSEKEKALLLRLSVFGRGRSLEAIEEVCARAPVERHEIIDLLGQLVDKSLITMEHDTAGEARYYMLESLWAYTRARFAETGETEIYRDRHLQFFVSLAEEAEPELERRDQARWLNKLSEESGNIRLAIDWSSRSSERTEAAMRLVSALGRYWEVRSRLQEGREYFESVMQRPEAQACTVLRAKMLEGVGRLAWCQDDDAVARAYYEEGIQLAGELGDERRVGRLLTFLSFLDRTDGDRSSAERRLAQARAIGERLGDKRILVVALSAEGSLASDDGDYARACDLKERSLAMYDEIGDLWIIGLLSWSLARVAIAHGDYERAATRLDALVATAQDLGNRWSLPYALEGYAEIAMGHGEYGHSARLFGAAEILSERFGLSRSAGEGILYEKLLERLHANLTQTDFEAAWREGRGLTLDQALELARMRGGR